MQEEKYSFIWNGSPFYVIKFESQIMIRPKAFAAKVPHVDLEKDNFRWHIDITNEGGMKIPTLTEYPRSSMTFISGSDVVAFTMGNGSIWPIPLKTDLEIETINSGSRCELFVNRVSRATITTNI